MSSEQTATLTAAAPAPGAGGPPPALPDVNVETHPFDYVVHLLEEVCYFDAYVAPEPPVAAGELRTVTPWEPSDYFGIDGGYGLDVRAVLHRFASSCVGPDFTSGMAVSQVVGPTYGKLRSRFMFCPPGFAWHPGAEPPPTLFDPYREQHFCLLDTELVFGSGGDSCTAYGLGRTRPVTVHGRPRVLAGAVGNLTGGRGKLAGVAGNFSFNGEISELGFRGYFSLRIVDSRGALRCERELPAPSPIGADPDATFIVMRGQKRDRTVRTEYGTPAGSLVRLVTPAQMRSVQYRSSVQGREGLRGQMVELQVIGNLKATVSLDILAPPGTAERPNDFSTVNIYTFSDPDGREVGTITAEIVLGKSFNWTFPAAPDQPAMRYAGYGPITGGTGQFAGVQGSLSVNSAISIAPHALSMQNVLMLSDPDGRFRAIAG